MNLVQKVFAGAGTEIPSTEIETDLSSKFSSLGEIFNFFLNAIIGIGWALVIVMLALGFVKYVLSQGEKTAVEGAQKWLTYAVIGGVGLFLVSVVKTLIPQLIGGGAENIGGGWLNF